MMYLWESYEKKIWIFFVCILKINKERSRIRSLNRIRRIRMFFGPPGSGSISQRCGSGFGTGSFPFLINVLSGMKKCLQNDILIQNFIKKFNLLDWRWYGCGQVIKKNMEKKFCLHPLKSIKKGVGSVSGSRAGSLSISQRYESGDLDRDPHHNVTDPQHCSLDIEN